MFSFWSRLSLFILPWPTNSNPSSCKCYCVSGAGCSDIKSNLISDIKSILLKIFTMHLKHWWVIIFNLYIYHSWGSISVMVWEWILERTTLKFMSSTDDNNNYSLKLYWHNSHRVETYENPLDSSLNLLRRWSWL